LFSGSVIDAATLQAYRETHYRVLGEDGFTLMVDVPSPALLAAHRRHRVDASPFLTACNPHSVRQAAASNAEAHTRLARELRSRSLAFAEGIGEHPCNGWPGEESFLVFGLALEAAKVLGAQFGQNAIVWASADAVPRLVMLR